MAYGFGNCYEIGGGEETNRCFCSFSAHPIASAKYFFWRIYDSFLQTDEKYRQYEDELTEHMETCDGVLDQVYLFHAIHIRLRSYSSSLQDFFQVDSTLSLFNDLQTQHRQVAAKTKSLHDSCERLVSKSFQRQFFSIICGINLYCSCRYLRKINWLNLRMRWGANWIILTN